jgi:hypothetical protein
MSLVIFDGNTKNYTVLNKNDNDIKIELINVQADDNNELPAPEQTMSKTTKKSKKLTKKNKEFLNSLTNDLANKIELTKESQDFLNALKT